MYKAQGCKAANEGGGERHILLWCQGSANQEDGETREESKKQFMRFCVQQSKKYEFTIGTLRSYWNIFWEDLIWFAFACHEVITNGSVGEFGDGELVTGGSGPEQKEVGKESKL